MIRCSVGTLHETAGKEKTGRMALILVGDFLKPGPAVRSRLYDPAFTTGYRKAAGKGDTQGAGI